QQEHQQREAHRRLDQRLPARTVSRTHRLPPAQAPARFRLTMVRLIASVIAVPASCQAAMPTNASTAAARLHSTRLWAALRARRRSGLASTTASLSLASASTRLAHTIV